MSELRKDNVVEIFWGCLGALLGSLAPALQVFPKIGNTDDPMGLLDVLVVVTMCVSGILAIVMGVFWYKRSKGANDLVSTIRSRPQIAYTNESA